jgi:hypothetical protein
MNSNKFEYQGKKMKETRISMTRLINRVSNARPDPESTNVGEKLYDFYFSHNQIF